MYSITIHDGKNNWNIEGIPDAVGDKIMQEAKTAQKVANLYKFRPGNICRFVSDDDRKESCFCLTKVWFEDIDKGFFSAIYANGDVIAAGSLDLIKYENDILIPYESFMKNFNERIY